MKPFDRLSDYLGAIERRLRLLAWTRGAAVTAAAALTLTVAAVLVANQFSFSNPSVIGARLFLFLGLAFALAVALVVPVIRLNRRRAARKAETRYPQFEERLLTFSEKVEQSPNDPFLHLLAADALQVAQQAEAKEVARTSILFGLSSTAVAALVVLVWLGVSGPGFLGYGTSLLWGGIPKGGEKPYYAIQVDPGNKTVRKRADLLVSATLMGFQASKVRFFAKYASASQWEEAEMGSASGGAEYQFLIPGVAESLDYYVEAGGVRSETYKVKVIDLPAVKKTRVTYHFPAWSGMKDEVEDPGGDLRAVEGTVADVEIFTDRPLANGTLVMEDGSKLPLSAGPSGTTVAKVPIQKDGKFFVAAIESGEDVRLGNDYFIEAIKDQAPELRVTKPGRDFRATPIEEVTVQVEAKDDFGLKNVTLHYSVNGGEEKTLEMLKGAGSKNGSGQTVISLEDFKLIPGDVVSLYATAKDARKTVNTDMFFIEAQPFERNYTQSQQAGGGGGGGGDEDQSQISQRQKEIITATWNQVKGQGAKGTDAENAAFLASVQSKLRDQAKSLAERMRARQLEGAGESFKTFVADMEQAVAAMGPAADKLKIAKWSEALQPEQKALQHLLRAEATFRDIQVAFGQRGGGGGGGGGGATRDLQGLFDLELDTEKNQYESARGGLQGGGESQQKQVDEMLQKLKELARRQQELAEQQRRNQQQTPQQRWEQEQLRREAEKLQQQMQQMQNSNQLSRNSQPQQGQQQGEQQGQSQQGQGKQGQQQQRGQEGQQGNQMSQAGQQQMQRTIENLRQAMEEMRQANNPNEAGTPQSEAQARKAAERLREAEQLLSGMRGQQSASQLDDLTKQAEDLARKQQEFEGQMRGAFGNERGPTREQAEQLARQKEEEFKELKNLESGMQQAVRDLQSTQRQASTKVRDALGDVQQMELGRNMQRNAEWIRRGMGRYAVMSEAQTTAGLNELRDQLKQAQQAMGKGNDKSGEAEQAAERSLRQVEQLRRQLEAMSQQQQAPGGRNGQQGQPQAEPGQKGQQPGQQSGQQSAQGQQPGQGMQPGQAQSSQGQTGQGQKGQGSQPGGQQQANGQPGGMQDGRGGNTGGAWGGAWNGGYGGQWLDGPVRPADIQQSYRDAMQSLQQLQQQYRDDPNAARDIQGLIRGLREFDPFAMGNDTLLGQRITAALAGVEQVEMELRRKVDATTGGGSVRSPGGERVPEGFARQVEEYFRKLSKGK